MGIQIDTSRDGLFDKLGLQRLKESYMREDEDTPQKRFAFVSSTFGSDPEHAQRLYDYSSKRGCLTLLLSYLLVDQKVCPFLFLITSTIHS